MRVTAKQIAFRALFALADMGRKLHTSLITAEDLEGYGPKIRRALVTDYRKAIKLRAYVLERPWVGRGHGWRLNRYCGKDGAQSDVGPVFETGTAFYDSLGLLQELVRR